MQVRETYGGCKPTSSQLLFVKACIADKEEVVSLWKKWLEHNSLDAIDDVLFNLIPTLYKNLARAGYDGAEMGLLKGNYRRNWYLLQTLSSKISKVIILFRQERIPCVLLKGIATSHLYYPEASMRYMNDIDILVPSQDAAKAITLLRIHGWEEGLPLKEDYISKSHGNCFIHEDGSELDLHWHLFQEHCSAEKDQLFLDNVQDIEWKGYMLQTLSATDHLFHTCVHGFQWNPMPPIRWIIDAHFIVKQSGNIIDWQRLIMLAKQMNVTLRLGKVLEFLSGEVGVHVPKNIIDGLLERPVSRWVHNEYNVLVREDREHHNPKAEFWWPVLKMWYLHRRLSDGKGIFRLLLTFPSMLVSELRLPGIYGLCCTLLRRVGKKLKLRLVKSS